MDFITIGDLHLKGTNGKGALAKYFADSDAVVLREVYKILDIALQKAIQHVVFLGDVCSHWEMTDSGFQKLCRMFHKYPDLTFHLYPGNHDQRDEEDSDAQVTSLDSLALLCKQGKFENVRVYLKPETTKIGKHKVRFLPYPSLDFDPDALNFFHNDVYGAKGDNGRLNKSKDYKLSKKQKRAVAVGGHLHTNQVVGRKYFIGTCIQNYFGEGRKKFYGHVRWNGPDDYEVESVRWSPKYRLHTCTVTSKKDLQKIPCSKYDLIKLVQPDGSLVTTADYPKGINIVETSPFKSRDLLQEEIETDLKTGDELTVDVDAFFDAWTANANLDPDELKGMMKTKARLIGVKERSK
ncbi:hypothetical protein [Burkholderia phage BCSR5]|nr:hypothetical protein [Burkholderia phage BCSR5]